MNNPIAQLIHQPDGKQLEFKRDLSSPQPIMKTLTAFANTAGGRLIIGIADNGEVIGVEKPLDDEEWLCSMIADSIAPHLVPNIEMITVENKTLLLVVEVFLSGSRPHWIKKLGQEQGCFVRLSSSNRQADVQLIAELQRSVEGVINALVHSDYSQRGAPIRITFLDDRIEVESMGILLPGLTIEEMKQGTSRIRNHVIARVFRELHLIEQWGTGIRRIFEEASELGLPEPKIEEVGMRVRFTIYLAKEHKITSTQSGAQSVEILNALSGSPLSAAELMEALGLKTKTGAFKRIIKELLENEMIAYTVPEKPKSRLQKYRLTDKGEQQR